MLVALLAIGATLSSSSNLCKATLHSGQSIGGAAYKVLSKTGATACCAACVADKHCAAFVTQPATTTCLLKADLSSPHAKKSNNCGIVRGTPGPPGPPPKPPPPPPAPPPPGSPRWELVMASALPVIGRAHPDVVAHNIFSGFETGQFFRLNGESLHLFARRASPAACARPAAHACLCTTAAQSRARRHLLLHRERAGHVRGRPGCAFLT